MNAEYKIDLAPNYGCRRNEPMCISGDVGFILAKQRIHVTVELVLLEIA